MFRIEFSLTIVAAILTIIGYSINDTIVIFDRVRENRGLMRDADLASLLNTSITQTLGRTILTSRPCFFRSSPCSSWPRGTSRTSRC